MRKYKDYTLADKEQLEGVCLYRAFYNQRTTHADHDHCEYCMAEFSDEEGTLKEGYCTKDFYYWICEDCFNDLHDFLKWTDIEDIRDKEA